MLVCVSTLIQMPGVTVKDVNQQEFVRALAAFLKKWVMRPRIPLIFANFQFSEICIDHWSRLGQDWQNMYMVFCCGLV